jgi:hypothetical protein
MTNLCLFGLIVLSRGGVVNGQRDAAAETFASKGYVSS